MTRNSQNRHYEIVERAIVFIRSSVQTQPTLEEIAQAVHVSPHHLQRIFSEWAGLSPKRFLQYLTKEHAKSCLAKSFTVLEAADEVGLSSASRLHDLMITYEAMSPGEYQSGGAGLEIGFGVADSPFGNVLIAWTGRGICHVGFIEAQSDATQSFSECWSRACRRRDDDEAGRWSRSIFNSTLTRGRLPLVMRGTSFQLKVWEALIKTNPGDVLSYGQLSRRAGEPRAARAVGAALAANSIAYLIPCHRVIRESGVIGDFRWGSERKVAMQAWEQGRFSR
jgi:AraC family transcriptional regulator of adaptative response/methylated-DNA-[protein]-cysteine methyltransferase